MAFVQTVEQHEERRAVDHAPVTDLSDVRTAAGIPAKGDGYPGETWIIASEIDPRPTDEAYTQFVVFVRYAPEPPGGYFASPASRPWRAAVGGREKIYIPRDSKDGAGAAKDPQINSALDQFQEAVTDTKDLSNIILEKDVSTAPTLSSIIQFRGSVNSAAITILGQLFAARTLRMSEYTVPFKQTDTVSGSDFYTKRFELQHDPDTWDRYIRDEGFFEVVPPGVLARIFVNGNEIPERPQFLDGAGSSSATAVYLQRRIKDEEDWSTLGLPSTWP